jgi:hypothetical protein
MLADLGTTCKVSFCRVHQSLWPRLFTLIDGAHFIFERTGRYILLLIDKNARVFAYRL